MKQNRIKIILIIGIILLVAMVPTYNKARYEQSTEVGGGGGGASTALDPIQNPNSFKPGGVTQNDVNIITKKANSFVGIVVTVGVVISAVTLGILGIKYMLGSVEERAEYKKSMAPYLVGSILLFSASGVVGIIASLLKDVNL